jgi:hypothetical protein
MRAEEIDNASIEELQAQANKCFEESVGILDYLHKTTTLANDDGFRLRRLLEAQFYLTAVARRRDERTARRDLILECVVIALISIEIILSIIFGLWGLKEGRQQSAVLDHMDRSTSKTADILTGQGYLLESMITNTSNMVTTMGKLQKAQEDSLKAQKETLKSIGQMNTALQKQIDLAFEVSVAILADDSTKRSVVTNQTKTAIYIWGAKFDKDPPLKFADERFIAPGASYSFFMDPFYENAAAKIVKGAENRVDFDLYLRSANGKPYIAHSYIIERWDKDVMKFLTTTVSVRQEDWPANVR